jgi:hypothetical protein
MKFATEAVVRSVVAMAVVAGVSMAIGALAQQQPGCQLLRADGAAFVERCGDRLNSFALGLDDISRAAVRDAYGRFGFICPIELMCENKPEILGWFIDPQSWKQGAQDEWAIADLLMKRAWDPPPSVPKSSCDAFDAKVADMTGRAVCYEFRDIGLSVILIVAADEKTGFVLVFQQRGADWMQVRDKALQGLARFRIQRASGDSALMRWMK